METNIDADPVDAIFFVKNRAAHNPVPGPLSDPGRKVRGGRRMPVYVGVRLDPIPADKFNAKVPDDDPSVMYVHVYNRDDEHADYLYRYWRTEQVEYGAVTTHVFVYRYVSPARLR